MSATNDLKSAFTAAKNAISEAVSGRPLTPAPESSTGRTEVTKTQLKNFNPKMVSQSVNKTALHPGGVQ